MVLHTRPLDEALDHLDSSVTELISTLETGVLDQLSVDEKVAVWQRFERLRNRQPLIDHRLIGDAVGQRAWASTCPLTEPRSSPVNPP